MSPARLRRPLATAIVLALCAPAMAAESAGPACPIGTVVCPRPAADWTLCPTNDLLDFHEPGLPTEGDRAAADTEVTGRQTVSTDGENYVLEGDASIRQLDQLIRADRFTYGQASTAWTAEGNVRYQDRDLLMSAAAARGTTTPSTATLDGVRYQLLSARGNGRAAVAVLKDDDHAELTDTSFSTCPLDTPGWEFRAREMQLDQAEGVGVARDISFRAGDVPVFWLPYATFPLDDRRKSGFLFPEFGYSSERGFDLTVPYYLNLAPNHDLTLTPRLMTQRGVMLGGEFRYLTDSSRGDIEVQWLPDDRGSGRYGSRSLFHWDNRSSFGTNWGAVIDVNHASDDRWFEDFGRSLNIAATSLLPSSAYLVGNGTWWNAQVGGDEYQVTDPTLPQAAEPYRRLPRLTFNADRALVGGLDGGLKSEFVAFSKDDAVEGRRLDLYPYLAYPIETAAWFVRPEVGYRYTRYDIRDDDSRPDRGVPIASLDAGLRFERALSLGGSDYTQTLEPRVYYLRVPYRDQDNLPLFDTQETPFSFGQLFRTNRFIGADRQMDANNLTVALTSRLLDDSGDDVVSASIGQIRYFDEQRVQLPGRPESDWSGSAYVAELGVRLDDRWRATFANQWNPNTDRTDLSSIGVQNRFGRDGVFNLSYRFRRDFLEYVDGSVLVPISGAWRFVARWNYSLRDDTTLEAFAGLEHDSCCVAWRVLGRRYVHNIEGEASNALYFEVEFKGVGSIGQKTGDFLRRAILGYQ